MKVTLETKFKQGKERTFEVCVESGDIREMEKWVATPFTELKAGDIIRIKDNGQYHRDLDGNGLWIVLGTDDMTYGRIDVQPFTPKPMTYGKGGFLENKFIIPKRFKSNTQPLYYKEQDGKGGKNCDKNRRN